MDNAKRDQMLTEIHGDVKVVKSQQQSQTEQLTDIYKKLGYHDHRLTKVEIKQDTCPALEWVNLDGKQKQQKIGNKLMMISIIVAIIFNMFGLLFVIWKVHYDKQTKAQIENLNQR